MKASGADHGPRILSLCCLYPTPAHPQQGVFVQRRLCSLSRLAELRVVAPSAIVQLGNPKGSRVRLGRVGDGSDGCVAVSRPRWFYPPLSGSFTPFWLALQLVYPLSKMRKDFRFEVIDTHFGFPEGIAGALLASTFGVPFTMTLRGNEPRHSRGKLARFWMSFALRRAGRVFTVSDRLRQFAIDCGAEPARVRTVPNGVDAAVFSPRDRSACRMKYGLPLDRPLVVSAGALVERKGHHRVIEALQFLRANGLTAHLAVVGGPGPEGQYEKQLHSLVAERELAASVCFLGAVPAAKMAEVMSAADVFCLASTNEGWPNVVHEALACGAPVVATDVGAIPEMLAGGQYGIVVPRNDPRRLEQALLEALRRDWDRAAIADWGKARGWNQVAAEVLEEMQALLATPRNGR